MWDELAMTLPTAASTQYSHLALPGSSFSMQEQQTRPWGRQVAAGTVCRTPPSPKCCTREPGAAIQLCPSLSTLLVRHIHHWTADLPGVCNSPLAHGPPLFESRRRSRRAWSILPQGDWGNIMQMQKRPWIFTCSCSLVSRINGLCDNLFLLLSPQQRWQS